MEELLADLAPSDTWEIEKEEEEHVADLLKSAKSALGDHSQNENQPRREEADNAEEDATFTGLPAVDVSAFQPEPKDEEDTSHTVPLQKSKDTLDQEADDLLARILDEVKHEPPEPADEQAAASDGEEVSDDVQYPDSKSKANAFNLDLPTTPSQLPDPPPLAEESSPDDDLTSRFASLSLPSFPTGINFTNKSIAKPSTGFTDEEIDTWCIICDHNATLQCIGCDGDLYCTNCWMEGHRGEDASFEERKHKAVQFVKGVGKNKVPKRRVMMGA